MPSIKEYKNKKSNKSKKHSDNQKSSQFIPKHAKRRPHTELHSEEDELESQNPHDGEQETQMKLGAIDQEENFELTEEKRDNKHKSNKAQTAGHKKGLEDTQKHWAHTDEAHFNQEQSGDSLSNEMNATAEEGVRVEFPYSELLRAQAPKVFDFADKVATEWVNDGSFENIPSPHPLAQLAISRGLRAAKDVEKKLEEKGVFMMAKVGVDYLKSKIGK